jgi:hypothetical protein
MSAYSPIATDARTFQIGSSVPRTDIADLFDDLVGACERSEAVALRSFDDFVSKDVEARRDREPERRRRFAVNRQVELRRLLDR